MEGKNAPGHTSGGVSFTYVISTHFSLGIATVSR